MVKKNGNHDLISNKVFRYYVRYFFLLSMFFITPVLTAQTCNDNIIKTKNDDRYLDAGDGTVIDVATGLMWQQCSLGQNRVVGQNDINCDGTAMTFTWRAALQQAQTINSGGFASYTDWRLPNRNELFSLVETACDEPAININIFPNTPNWYYWSSSPHTYQVDSSWYVRFRSGGSSTRLSATLSATRDDKRYLVRLVRSGAL